MKIVVMAASGVGKAALAAALASPLRAAFLNADDLHPATNIARLAAGHSLTEDMIVPWLTACGHALQRRPRAVLSCPCLKRSHRDQLRAASPGLMFIHPQVSGEKVLARLGPRAAKIVVSRENAAFERPSPEEKDVVQISGGLSTGHQVIQIMAMLSDQSARPAETKTSDTPE